MHRGTTLFVSDPLLAEAASNLPCLVKVNELKRVDILVENKGIVKLSLKYIRQNYAEIIFCFKHLNFILNVNLNRKFYWSTN